MDSTPVQSDSAARRVGEKFFAGAASGGKLSPLGRRRVGELVHASKGANISPVVKVGQTGYSAGFDASPRSVDHNWSHVKISRGEGAESQRPREGFYKAGSGSSTTCVRPGPRVSRLGVYPAQGMDVRGKNESRFVSVRPTTGSERRE